MHPLSKQARFILDRMEPDRPYEPGDLGAFSREINSERLREIMQELWINRQVERVGYSGWRRHRSPSPHLNLDRPSGKVEAVKPEDLFDHATFADFFK
jgi:hypothetical protein